MDRGARRPPKFIAAQRHSASYFRLRGGVRPPFARQAGTSALDQHGREALERPAPSRRRHARRHRPSTARRRPVAACGDNRVSNRGLARSHSPLAGARADACFATVEITLRHGTGTGPCVREQQLAIRFPPRTSRAVTTRHRSLTCCRATTKDRRALTSLDTT